jgi:hypothetical protein
MTEPRLPPALLIEARERAKVVAWLMLFRQRARDILSTPEAAGAVDGALTVLIEEIAMGEHRHLKVEVETEDLVFH